MKQFLKSNKGQAMMEYIIISSLVGIFCLGAMKLYGQTIKTRIKHMKSEITKNMEV